MYSEQLSRLSTETTNLKCTKWKWIQYIAHG